MKETSRIKIFIVTVMTALTLSGCQTVNDGLHQINNGLSIFTGMDTGTDSSIRKQTTSAANKKHIQNPWNASDKDAMAWLAHNQITWNNHGKIKDVNWYDFWAQQIHYKTSLANKAYQYCHKKAWETPKPGTNCQTYFQAYSMTNSEESIDWGNKMRDAV